MSDPSLPLEEQLFESPFDYDIFQAVRLLHLMLDDRPGVGRIAKPAEEPVRFKVRQSLAFPPSSIHSLSAEADPPQMTVAFLGLTGFQGVLPHHYTEHILARAESKDLAMAEFFDLFNHRILSLFYRAWEKHQFPVRFQAAAVKQEIDAFTQYLFDWIGMGTGRLHARMAVPDRALLRYAGLLGQMPRCAVALGAILQDYFGVEVHIEEFVGAWYTLQEEDQCDLRTESMNNQLGLGAIAGAAVWDPLARFRVQLGPLSLVKFLAFLPDGLAVKEFQDLVRFYIGPIMQFDLQLVLQANEVPFSRLGDDSPAGPRLGWCAWLKTGEFVQDAGDATFALSC
jgi:type VI secretion system protein ImpH